MDIDGNTVSGFLQKYSHGTPQITNVIPKNRPHTSLLFRLVDGKFGILIPKDNEKHSSEISHISLDT